MIYMSVAMEKIPLEDRPRERFLKVGVENLSNEELLSILLKTGFKGQSVQAVSRELLYQLGGMEHFQNVTMSYLTKTKGIGKIKAMELLTAIELGKRIFYKTESSNLLLKTPADIYEKMRYLFVGKKQECFYCLYFNTKQELIERKLLFMGTVNRSLVHPREVFKEAYLNSASAIVCLHNHPSNDLTPSQEDKRLTKALVEIGELNGIPVVDHIIVGDYGYYSFYEHHLLERHL